MGIKDILQGADIVKFIKSIRLRWYGHDERMQSQGMPEQTTTFYLPHTVHILIIHQPTYALNKMHSETSIIKLPHVSAPWC